MCDDSILSMKVLVTGANGFVGKSLISELKRRGFFVIGVSRQLFDSDADAIYVIADYFEESLWRNILLKVDVVIHLAAIAHELNGKQPVNEYFRSNFDASILLANIANACGVKRFIFMSTIGVHADENLTNPVTEGSKIKANNAYATSKLMAENYLKNSFKNTLIKWVILRPTLVYGPNNPGNMLKLIKLVNSGIPLPLGALKNRKSLIYIENLVDAIILCITHPKAENNVFLLADNEKLNLVDIVKKIAFYMNKSVYIFSFPKQILILITKATGQYESFDKLSKELIVDNSKIVKELGWNPPFTIDDGLKKTAEWYCSSLNK